MSTWNLLPPPLRVTTSMVASFLFTDMTHCGAVYIHTLKTTNNTQSLIGHVAHNKKKNKGMWQRMVTSLAIISGHTCCCCCQCCFHWFFFPTTFALPQPFDISICNQQINEDGHRKTIKVSESTFQHEIEQWEKPTHLEPQNNFLIQYCQAQMFHDVLLLQLLLLKPSSLLLPLLMLLLLWIMSSWSW